MQSIFILMVDTIGAIRISVYYQMYICILNITIFPEISIIYIFKNFEKKQSKFVKYNYIFKKH